MNTTAFPVNSPGLLTKVRNNDTQTQNRFSVAPAGSVAKDLFYHLLPVTLDPPSTPPAYLVDSAAETSCFPLTG